MKKSSIAKLTLAVGTAATFIANVAYGPTLSTRILGKTSVAHPWVDSTSYVTSLSPDNTIIGKQALSYHDDFSSFSKLIATQTDEEDSRASRLLERIVNGFSSGLSKMVQEIIQKKDPIQLDNFLSAYLFASVSYDKKTIGKAVSYSLNSGNEELCSLALALVEHYGGSKMMGKDFDKIGKSIKSKNVKAAYFSLSL